jgi:tRNA pseudouridine38-40 synthase
MSNIRLVLEYLGTHYHGWQRQTRLPTLQGVLEDCIHKICGEKIKLIGAGRTDAGVHALGQVANFKTSSKLTAESWKNALNALLPSDIVILDAQKVPNTFHARRLAKSKTYQYRILNRRTPSALLDQRVWHLPWPLRTDAMRKGAKHLVGLHDFRSFCGKAGTRKSTTSRLSRIIIRRQADLILFTLTGSHFLQYMVRNIVGTLLEVGMGKIPPKQVKDILQGRDRRLAGPTAPPQGLFLVKVHY